MLSLRHWSAPSSGALFGDSSLESSVPSAISTRVLLARWLLQPQSWYSPGWPSCCLHWCCSQYEHTSLHRLLGGGGGGSIFGPHCFPWETSLKSPLGPLPASCTNSGALPMFMAAVGSITSCVRPEDSSGHGTFGDAAAADSAAAASSVAQTCAFCAAPNSGAMLSEMISSSQEVLTCV